MADRSDKFVTKEDDKFEIDRSRAKGGNLLAGRMARRAALREAEMAKAAQADATDQIVMVRAPANPPDGTIRVTPNTAQPITSVPMIVIGSDGSVYNDPTDSFLTDGFQSIEMAPNDKGRFVKAISEDADLSPIVVTKVLASLATHLGKAGGVVGAVSLMGVSAEVIQNTLQAIKDIDAD